jgi:hypothetical protein
MTQLNTPVSRRTAKIIGGRQVIVTLAPCGSQAEARIGLRLAGKRTQYVCLLSDVFRLAALWHGQREATAKRQARKQGIAWRVAKKQFTAENSI